MIITIIIIVVVALWVMSSYNSMVSLRNKVEEGFSTMDVYLKKRFDLIPNLVATVKGYAAHEAETLEKVIGMRSNATTMEQKVDAERQISDAVKSLMVQVEAYPDLKANQNFLNLQEQLNGIEEDIANARRYYNGCVRQFNTMLQQFPGNIVANLFHFQAASLYQVDESAERKNVKVDFGK